MGLKLFHSNPTLRSKTHTHTHTHARTHTNRHNHRQTDRHTHTHTYIHTNTQTHTHACPHIKKWQICAFLYFFTRSSGSHWLTHGGTHRQTDNASYIKSLVRLKRGGFGIFASRGLLCCRVLCRFAYKNCFEYSKFFYQFPPSRRVTLIANWQKS